MNQMGSRNRSPRAWQWLATLCLCTAAAPAWAAAPVDGCSALQDPLNVPVSDPRLVHDFVAGTPVDVLLPPGYGASHRRYPVLYLYHGAFDNKNQFSAQTDLLAYTGTLPDAQQAIVVMPEQGNLPAATDWHDGSHLQETFLVRQLIPYVEARYRARTDRAHRAAAGFSGGGLDAALLAARHPDLFVAAGSFSGLVDQLTPRGIAVVEGFIAADRELCGGQEDLFGIWGNPLTERILWRDHDPTELAPALTGVSVYVASGNGVSCIDDPEPQSLENGLVEEATVYEMGRNFDAALSAAGIPHTADFYGCGSHIARYYQRDLHVFWPLMLHALGSAPPPAFDYRTADARFSVWGWFFAADRNRATEFMDVRKASASGLVLRGSGIAQVTTAALFAPRAIVTVSGAWDWPQTLKADAQGRLGFDVNLGPAHAAPQDTPEALAAAALDPHYFKERAVRFATAR